MSQRKQLAFHENLGMRLRGAYLTVHRRTNAHFAQFGMTSDQWVVLSLLDEEDGITQRELTERSFSDPNTIAAMLTVLERRGLVRRDPHEKDGRARSVRLTDEGRATVRKLAQSMDEFHHLFQATLPTRSSKVIQDWLARVADVMRQPK